ncbi:MAG: NAD-dependent epimerase [Cyanobacteria bacterium J06598_4]
MQILVTGAAGFIGYHLSNKLLALGYKVCGIDNLNDYYDVRLKKARLAQLLPNKNFRFKYLDLSDRDGVAQLFANNSFDCVINLAAQAGVRYSLKNPHAYVDSNLVGFTNILEGCRHRKIEHLIFASSSSVYGANTKIPFAENDQTDRPVSLYAATKKANELMAYSYSHLYNLPITGLRFFTVYGPWGRPDMAYFKFTQAIAQNQPIDVYNYGKMKRDFTYIDDVVAAVTKIISHRPQRSAEPPYKVYNLGNNNPVELEEFIRAIETSLGVPAQKNLLPMQPGDVVSTYADIDELTTEFDFQPTTSINRGIAKFVEWYRQWYCDFCMDDQQLITQKKRNFASSSAA